MSKTFKNLIFTCFNYNKRIVQMSQEFKIQFLACLLALLAGRPRFRLVVGLIGLIIDLAMGKAESIGKKVAVSLSGCFL